MNDDRFQRASDIFDRAESIPTADRPGFLDRECAGDPELRAEVDSLLASRDVLGGFLAAPAVGWVGHKIGAYTVESLISEGGMGVVLRARQEQPQRSVAIKLIKGPDPGEATRQRFELEAEVLGRLDHPGIAHIYDAGYAERDGRPVPYFVMELIEGQPLTRHATERDLDQRRRVELMIAVCEAIHHAHLRGVIHRDLKPSNILVRADGVPKILDFGVARVTDADVQLTTMHTHVGQILGTLPYMSPEQVSGRHDQLDLRSDVYSLGVLLYELLTGRLPQDLADRDLVEAARIIATEDADTLGSDQRRYPTDLETIVAKSLRKEPARRYASAADLAADLRRFLTNQPITARRATTVYQLRKFARRHRDAVVLGMVSVALLVAGLLVSVAGWSAAHRAGVRATAAAAEATALSDVLVDMLEAPDPQVSGREVRVADLLDRAAEQSRLTLADRPRVASRMHGVLGETYRGLGLYPEAVREFELAVERAEQAAAGSADTILAKPLITLANMHVDFGQIAAADSLLARVDLAVPGLAPDSPQRYRAAYAHGGRHDVAGQPERAVMVLEPALAGATAALGPDHELTIDLQSSLGNALWQVGEAARARDLLEASLVWIEASYGPNHQISLHILNNLAMVYENLDDLPRSREVLEQSLAVKREVLGPDHPSTAIGHFNLASTLRKLDEPEAAVPHHERALVIAGSQFAPGDRRLHVFQAGYGATLIDLARYDEALVQLEACYSPLAEAYGADHSRARIVAQDLARVHAALGDQAAREHWRALGAP